MDDQRKSVNSYIGVIKSLRDIIESDYSDGGWLPSGREMARQLDVGYSTYCKAIKFLDREGLVKGLLKKGHYVFPQYMRVKKIGIVLEEGAENPFIQSKQLVIGAMNHLADSSYEMQILQGVSNEIIGECAVSYGVKGIIWFFPNSKSWKGMKQIETETGIPIVAVSYYHLGKKPAHHASVTYDARKGLRKRFRLMIERGHRRLLYIGKYDLIQTYGIDKILEDKEVPFSEENCLDDIWKTPRKLVRKIKKLRITGIISEGGGLTVQCLFETLSELAEKCREAKNANGTIGDMTGAKMSGAEQADDFSCPEVIVSHFAELGSFYERFPKVRLIGNVEKPEKNIGESAVRMLLEHLEKGTEMKTLQVIGE